MTEGCITFRAWFTNCGDPTPIGVAKHFSWGLGLSFKILKLHCTLIPRCEHLFYQPSHWKQSVIAEVNS